MFFIVPLGHLHKTSSKSVHNFLCNIIHKQTDKPSLPKTQPPLFICLYSLNNNKHSRFCKVTHTRDFHGLQLVLFHYFIYQNQILSPGFYCSVCLNDEIPQQVDVFVFHYWLHPVIIPLFRVGESILLA